MFHSNTERLMEYWRARRGGRPMPRRGDIDPAELAALLPRLVMLAPTGAGFEVRLAGEAARAIAGAPLKGVIGQVIAPEHRSQFRALLRAAFARAQPLVLLARACDAPAFDVELAFLPLADSKGRPDRLLALIQPLSTPGEGRAPRRFALLGIAASAGPGASAPRLRPPLRLAAIDGRRVA